MSPLKRLFGYRNRQPSLEEQLESLEGQSEADLLALVQSDSQETLREAALNHLSYSQTLLNLALNEGNGRLQQSARKRIGQLLESEKLTVEQLSQAVSNQAQLLALSSYSPTAGQQVMAQINEPDLLLELANKGASIQIRRAAAERITTRPELEQLAKTAQGRDKTVYKLAKSRLERFKAEDARQAEAEAQARVICDKLEQLLKLEQDPMFQARLDKLAQDWARLPATLPSELAQRYEGTLSAWREQQSALITAQQQAEAQKSAQAEAEKTELLEAENTLKEVRDILERLLVELYQADTEALTDSHVQSLIDLINQRLTTLAGHQHQPAIQALSRQQEQVLALQSRLRDQGTVAHWLEQLHQSETPEAQANARQTLKQLIKPARNLPETEQPEPVKQALAELRAGEEAEKQAVQAQRKLIRELEGLARQGLSAAQGGQVRRARGLHRATQEKRPALDSIPTHLATKLEELDLAIERLSDWHEFAVTPKKEALIRQMEALAQSTIVPEELARKIHQLQDDWREVSKGVPHHDEDLWHQFQEASHKAFEPCREFFHAQAQEREANQAKRDELIEQLSQYVEGYNWEQPVWKDVDHTLKQARREWREAWPVPRQAIKAQEARFEPLMDQIHARLSEGYEAHRDAKEQLVERAHALTEKEELNEAIEGAKQLQSEWKKVGPCRPRDDQNLWKQFRQHCDAIFERRQEQFQAADQERQAHAQEAEDIIEQLRNLAKSGGESPSAQRARIEELKTAFRNVGELPRARLQALNDDFQNAVKALDRHQHEARAQAKERHRQQLFNAAEAVRVLELAHVSGGDISAAQEDADSALSAVEHWPGESRELLDQRRNTIDQLTPVVQQQNLEGLQLLCIRAEILTEKETPETDKPLRMNYQMRQLQQGLGKSEETAAQLAQEWLGLGGVPDPDYTWLLTRFRETLKDQF